MTACCRNQASRMVRKIEFGISPCNRDVLSENGSVCEEPGVSSEGASLRALSRLGTQARLSIRTERDFKGSGRPAVVVVQHAAQALAPLDCTDFCKMAHFWADKPVGHFGARQKRPPVLSKNYPGAVNRLEQMLRFVLVGPFTGQPDRAG
jgi:hypothetical protein